MLSLAHSMFVCVALQPEIHVNACCNARIENILHCIGMHIQSISQAFTVAMQHKQTL